MRTAIVRKFHHAFGCNTSPNTTKTKKNAFMRAAFSKKIDLLLGKP